MYALLCTVTVVLFSLVGNPYQIRREVFVNNLVSFSIHNMTNRTGIIYTIIFQRFVHLRNFSVPPCRKNCALLSLPLKRKENRSAIYMNQETSSNPSRRSTSGDDADNDYARQARSASAIASHSIGPSSSVHWMVYTARNAMPSALVFMFEW